MWLDWKIYRKTRIYTMKETINQIYWIGNNNWKTRKYTLKKLLGQSMLIEWYTVKFRGKIYWEILGEKPTRGTESLFSQNVINICFEDPPVKSYDQISFLADLKLFVVYLYTKQNILKCIWRKLIFFLLFCSIISFQMHFYTKKIYQGHSSWDRLRMRTFSIPVYLASE